MRGDSIFAIPYKYFCMNHNQVSFVTYNTLVILKDTFANKESAQDNTEN